MNNFRSEGPIGEASIWVLRWSTNPHGFCFSREMEEGKWWSGSNGGGDGYVVNHFIYLYTKKIERRLAGHVNHGAMIRPYKNGGSALNMRYDPFPFWSFLVATTRYQNCVEAGPYWPFIYRGVRERERGRPHSRPTDCSTCLSLLDNDNNW